MSHFLKESSFRFGGAFCPKPTFTWFISWICIQATLDIGVLPIRPTIHYAVLRALTLRITLGISVILLLVWSFDHTHPLLLKRSATQIVVDYDLLLVEFLLWGKELVLHYLVNFLHELASFLVSKLVLKSKGGCTYSSLVFFSSSWNPTTWKLASLYLPEPQTESFSILVEWNSQTLSGVSCSFWQGSSWRDRQPPFPRWRLSTILLLTIEFSQSSQYVISFLVTERTQEFIEKAFGLLFEVFFLLVLILKNLQTWRLENFRNDTPSANPLLSLTSQTQMYCI